MHQAPVWNKEDTSSLHHSPILGWAFDGYPVYGPYGYSDPTDPTSPVRPMVSSYRLRDITDRTTLPGWAAQVHFGDNVQLDDNGEYPLAPSQYGPAVSAQYPLGWYTEDYEYVAGLGDLDQYNGRWCVTPEFPQGTYAYFVTIDDQGNPAFPYYLGREYYGQATSGRVHAIDEGVTVVFDINGTRPSNAGPTGVTAATDCCCCCCGASVHAGGATLGAFLAEVGMDTGGGLPAPAVTNDWTSPGRAPADPHPLGITDGSDLSGLGGLTDPLTPVPSRPTSAGSLAALAAPDGWSPTGPSFGGGLLV